MMTVLKEAKRLYDMGFAILWLYPKNKNPIDDLWTTGPRKTWKELAATYRPGYNMGVRLGEPSQINGAFLHALDIDLHTTDPRHKKEAYDAAAKCLRNSSCPIVASGSGNGSCHIYFLSKTPIKGRIAASLESVSLSKEGLDGTGKRYKKAPLCWTVTAYGLGGQCVLPPSIHPISGKAYAWQRPIKSADSLPLVDLLLPEKAKSLGDKRRSMDSIAQDWKPTNVQLEWLELSKETVALIKNGTWRNEPVSDQSAYLWMAIDHLLGIGCDVDDITTILTDTRYALGRVSYAHAKTDSRKRAAKWIVEQNINKMLTEREKRREMSGDADGFYRKGEKGKLIPDYDKLLGTFDEETRFKTFADLKQVFQFNGTHYVPLSEIEIKAFAEARFEPKPTEKMRSEFFSKVKANNVFNRQFFIESTEAKLNFKNGILDLPTRTLMPHSPDYGFRGVLPYDYDLTAQCPFFRKWIQDIMRGDQDLVAILQEYMGYVVRGGDYKYHKALWLGGEGRNGKSTLVDVIKALIGAGNFSVVSIKALMSDRFAGSDLDGKIANFSEETSKHELQDSGPFKNLTGDGEIQAQYKFGPAFNLRNRAKLVMTYNKIPDLSDLSTGMLSRPLIVPFLKVIKEDEFDQGIKQKLLAELPGIFNFALEGWDRLEQQSGFTKSAKSAAALQTVKDESCNVTQWVNNNVRVMDSLEEGNQFSSSTMYAIYRKQERYAHKSSEFYRRLKRHPKLKDRYGQDKNGSFYRGLVIRDARNGISMAD